MAGLHTRLAGARWVQVTKGELRERAQKSKHSFTWKRINTEYLVEM